MSVLRRMMIGGFNIEAFPSSRKIYYTASEKIIPKENSLGSKVQLNIYDASTMNGVLVSVNDITTIGREAFFECSSLTSVTIPDSVTKFEFYAFYGCSGLTSITIPNSVRYIEKGALSGCSSLTSITIPNSVIGIREAAFAGCNSLISVTIGNSVTSIGSKVVTNCHNLIEFKGKYATEDGRSLIINNTIIAYANASGTTYTIPNSVTKIVDYAFYNCDSITSVTIPDSVTSIGGYAFSSCDSLTSVYCKATTPPVLDGLGIFDYNSSSRNIYVPIESVDTYKSADRWSKYADAIVGYDFENNTVIE